MLDNIFEELKSRLFMPDVARFYGLEINRAGFAACPFHPDNTPSLKFDDSFLRSVFTADRRQVRAETQSNLNGGMEHES